MSALMNHVRATMRGLSPLVVPAAVAFLTHGCGHSTKSDDQLDAGSEQEAGTTHGGNDASDVSDASDASDAGDAGDAGSGSLPMFLLAGQSNMEGNVDKAVFEALLTELSGSARAASLKTLLYDWYFKQNDGYASYGYSETMADFEVTELLRLHKTGLVDADLMAPYDKVWCAMNEMPVAPLATNCGHPFGPELVLGHVLGTTSLSPTSLIKVAKGGTTLVSDWRSPRSGGTTGPWYQALRDRIQSLRSAPVSVHPDCVSKSCHWAAFIWFQGENDSFDRTAAESYAQNLKNLLADVRDEVGTKALPVIIIKIGKWAQSVDFGATVAAAQESVAKADPYTDIVLTDDLSGFYHYDPAAQLIIGERAGVALKGALK